MTSVSTLRSRPGSMLDAMFSGRHAVIEEEGSVFLDRDGSGAGVPAGRRGGCGLRGRRAPARATEARLRLLLHRAGGRVNHGAGGGRLGL